MVKKNFERQVHMWMMKNVKKTIIINNFINISNELIVYCTGTFVHFCKDQFRLESRIGMDPGPRSPNNKFIECGRES